MNAHYSLLGVTTSSSPEEVRSAYFRMARLYHPDKLKQTTADASTPSFISIRSAYEAIQVDQQRHRSAKNYSRLAKQIVNLIQTIYADSDSQQEEINDAYFEERARMMDRRYEEIQSIFKKTQKKGEDGEEEETDASENGRIGSRKTSEEEGEEGIFRDKIKKKVKCQ